MRCGHCKIDSTTVEHVRRCSRATYAPEGHRMGDPIEGVGHYTKVERTPVTEAGIYRVGDTIYKVQKAREGDHLYAKKFVPPGPGDTEGFFVYEIGLLRHICAEDRLTLDEAKAYGALYGTCIVCGRTLTNEVSIAAGIGPICAGRV